MSSLNDWITCFVDSSKAEKAQDIAFNEIKREIGNDGAALLNLVVALEPHLTAIKDKERSRASLLLAKLLEEIDQPLSASQIHHFCVFFNSRLADYPSVSPALLALRVLIERQGQHMDLKYCDIADIFTYVFRELEVHSLPQTIRQRIYELLNAILVHLKSNVKTQSSINSILSSGCRPHEATTAPRRVLTGILDCTFGEKDPRCLLKCFSISSGLYFAFFDEILKDGEAPDNEVKSEAGAAPLAEKIFDSLACYFPITFRPPPDDPFKVTPEMLVRSLNDALSGHPSLAAYTTPFMIEQIHNPSESAARLQALQCLRTLYSHQTTYSHGRTSSTCFRELAEGLFELCCSNPSVASAASDASQSAEIKDESLALIQIICRRLAIRCSQTTASVSAVSDWTHFGEYLLKMCAEGLQVRSGNPLDSQASSNEIHLCAAIGSSCLSCAEAVHRAILPILVPVVSSKLDELCAAPSDLSSSTPSQLDDRGMRNVNICCSALSHVVTLLRCQEESVENTGAQSKGVSFSPGSYSNSDELEGPSLVYCDDVNILWDSVVARVGTEADTRILTANKPMLRLYRDVLTCVQELTLRVNISTLQQPGSLGAVLERVSRTATLPAAGEVAAQARHSAVSFLQTLLSPGAVRRGEESCRRAALDALLGTHCVDALVRETTSANSAQASETVFSAIGALLVDVSSNSPQQQSPVPLRTVLASTLMSFATGKVFTSGVGEEVDVVKRRVSLETVANILPDEDVQGAEAGPSLSVKSILEALCLPHDGREGCALLELTKDVLDSSDPFRSCAAVSLQLVSTVICRAMKIMARLAEQDPSCQLAGLGMDVQVLTMCADRVETKVQGGVALWGGVVSVLLAALSHSSSARSDVWSQLRSEPCVPDDSAVGRAWGCLVPTVLNYALGNQVTNSSEDEVACGSLALQSAWIIALITNKAVASEAYDALLVSTLRAVIPSVLCASHTISPFQRECAVDLLLCVARGLVMRRDVCFTSTCANALSSVATGTPLAASLDSLKSWQEIVIAVVCGAIYANLSTDGRGSCVSIGVMVGQKFSVLACEQPSKVCPLSSGPHPAKYGPRTPLAVSSANCTLLWRQRLWSRVYPKLTQQLDSGSVSSRSTVDGGESRAVLLMCVCSLAAEMPVKLIAGALLDISRYAITGLTVAVSLCPPDAGRVSERSELLLFRFILRLKSLACVLSGLLFHTADSNAIESVFGPHVHALVPLLLQIIQSEKSQLPGSAAVRALSLQCLMELIQLPYSSIHPSRKTVINGLSFALDDPKRAVRKLAAKVRNAWIVMDSNK